MDYDRFADAVQGNHMMHSRNRRHGKPGDGNSLYKECTMRMCEWNPKETKTKRCNADETKTNAGKYVLRKVLEKKTKKDVWS